MLVSLSYVSRSLVGGDDGALAEIAAVAQGRNGALDVTGALYADAALFFQVLEGPETAVQTVFRSIRADPRHGDVRLLSHEPVAVRRFLGWRMKLVPAEALPAQTPRLIRRVARRPASDALTEVIEALR